MPSKRRVATVGMRAGVGIAGIAIAAITVGAAALGQWPTLAFAPPSTVVTPQLDAQQRVCPGPLLTLAEDSSQASAATSVGSASAEYSATTDGRAAVVKSTVLTAGDNADAGADGSPQLIETTPAPGAITLLAGSQSQTASAESLGGFAAAACVEAVGDAWLVGGSTDLGHTSLVLLTNPSRVVATVDLTVYGETGRVDAPGSTGIIVQPGSQRIVSLAGLAPDVQSPVVHVQSRGGQVAASLEEGLLRGIETGGVELTGATNGPSGEQVIPGFVVPEPFTPSAGGSTDGSTDGATDGAAPPTADGPVVRILAPGDAPATIQVGLVSEGGSSAGTSLEVKLQPGLATDVPLGKVAPGNYTVRLTADVPVVAAARAATSADFAWFAASAAQNGDFLVSVADGPAPLLHLHNASATDAALTLAGINGSKKKVTVPAGQSVVAPVAPAASLMVSGGTRIMASVSYAQEGLLSTFVVAPPGALAAPITVYAH